MKTGKITAKLRDAVPVCLMVEGAEVMRYKNIELPDMLKEVEMTDFHFNVHMDGKITFEIHYEPGVMQEVSENRVMEIHYNATGPRRKELATAVGAFLEATPVYQKAPTYALAIGEYIIDREGTLIGAENHALTEALAEQGFTVA